jgi:Ohr subfamily peroxiredoxin
MATAAPETVYTAHVKVTGGREGHATADDGNLDIELQRPGGHKRNATNPEQLFAAGFAACYQSALSAVGRQKGIDTSASVINAAVSLVKSDANFKLAVQFDITIPGTDAATARELVDQAHQLCPYSNATRGNIDVVFNVVKA